MLSPGTLRMNEIQFYEKHIPRSGTKPPGNVNIYASGSGRTLMFSTLILWRKWTWQIASRRKLDILVKFCYWEASLLDTVKLNFHVLCNTDPTFTGGIISGQTNWNSWFGRFWIPFWVTVDRRVLWGRNYGECHKILDKKRNTLFTRFEAVWH